MMLFMLIRRWWIPFLQGLCALIFGVMMLARENIGIPILVFSFGLYCLVDGIWFLSAASGAPIPKNARRRELLGAADLGVCIAATTLAWSGMNVEWLSIVAAAWSVWRGVVEVVSSFLLRLLIPSKHLLLLIGLSSALFNLSLLMSLFAGAGIAPWMLGVFAMTRGGLFIAIGLDLRGYKQAFRSHEVLLSSISENLTRIHRPAPTQSGEAGKIQ